MGPAYPGRGKHVGQCHFVTHPLHRQKGVGRVMGRVLRRVASAVGLDSVDYVYIYIYILDSLGAAKCICIQLYRDCVL